MKKLSLFVFLFAGMMSCYTLAGDECTDTCLKEYEECKAVSESATARRVCDVDLNECKAQCSQ